MKLTPEQLQTFQEKIDEKWTQDKSCVICGSAEWHISPEPYFVYEYGKEGRPFATGMAFVVLRCGNCAHSLFFNAVALGLLPEHGVPFGAHPIS